MQMGKTFCMDRCSASFFTQNSLNEKAPLCSFVVLDLVSSRVSVFGCTFCWITTVAAGTIITNAWLSHPRVQQRGRCSSNIYGSILILTCHWWTHLWPLLPQLSWLGGSWRTPPQTEAVSAVMQQSSTADWWAESGIKPPADVASPSSLYTRYNKHELHYVWLIQVSDEPGINYFLIYYWTKLNK